MRGCHVCAAACRVTHALQGHNRISDGGASSLSDALKFNTCLGVLNLVSAGCGKGGGFRGCDVHVAICSLGFIVYVSFLVTGETCSVVMSR